MAALFGKIFKNRNEGIIKKLWPLVGEINELEFAFKAMSDEDLKGTTIKLRSRLEAGETLDDLLPAAFAAVRESAWRTIGLRHFDVQLIGGIVLHQGKIAEMRTGEGKTLVATLAAYLNALEGQGVHVITVNDYLARRDTQWMGPVYSSLGMSISCLQHEQSFQLDPTVHSDQPGMDALRAISRQDAYAADLTYGTNHEFGFDYLRDNMAIHAANRVQRGLHYVIVDEVDNILIDEARTPLIISGPAQEATQTYSTMARIVPRLQIEEDFTVDEKHRTISLTEEGIATLERALNIDNLYEPGNYQLTHYVENAIRALVIFQKDKDYLVENNEIILVDEFTGRKMYGRRYSDGLHQALEAKEGVKVQQETITYATITLQNYFRMHDKLAGMTGTAMTEAEEFMRIYHLDVVTIPTNMPNVRADRTDYIYKTEDGKWNAILEDIKEAHEKGRPVLVGTASIETSEVLDGILIRNGIPHQVLNAKNHEQEAHIVAQAGRVGAVTVATNMAGRGTDIILGGNEEMLLINELRRKGHSTLEDAPRELMNATKQTVTKKWTEEHQQIIGLGGLYVIGTEKNDARRIDNQLRGRTGRQGDPGATRFYVSMEDDLMRRFGGDRVKSAMNFMGLEDDQPLENTMVSKALGNAQTKVEAYHFEIRKHLVEYDDVINTHREVIYEERRKVLDGADLKSNILDMIEKELGDVVTNYVVGSYSEDWALGDMVEELRTIFPLSPVLEVAHLQSLNPDAIHDEIQNYAEFLYSQREEAVGVEQLRTIERLVTLRTIDSHWVVHLTSMENLRQGVGLHAYGQRDPLVMYRSEGHEKFQEMLRMIQHDIVHTIFHATMMEEEANRSRAPRRAAAKASGVMLSPMASSTPNRQPVSTVGGATKIGRNDVCPCGSGKKYKRCHGIAA
ncbi:MAG: preprotein translocase subunit SecA [Chloroflexota bacterium]|nr:preprotein translocase subunit SecA [Chloroflexota bacterium]